MVVITENSSDVVEWMTSNDYKINRLGSSKNFFDRLNSKLLALAAAIDLVF